MSEQWTVLPGCSINIETQRNEGPTRVQIPAYLILAMDDILRWIRDTGLTFTLCLVPSNKSITAAMKWQATCGGVDGDGATPWAAIKSLADRSGFNER